MSEVGIGISTHAVCNVLFVGPCEVSTRAARGGCDEEDCGLRLLQDFPEVELPLPAATLQLWGASKGQLGGRRKQLIEEQLPFLRPRAPEMVIRPSSFASSLSTCSPSPPASPLQPRFVDKDLEQRLYRVRDLCDLACSPRRGARLPPPAPLSISLDRPRSPPLAPAVSMRTQGAREDCIHTPY